MKQVFRTYKKQIIDKVLKPITDAGFDVFFVGGCVRDELLGKEPHDSDLVTSATPEDLHSIFNRFSNVSKNSEPFGVTIPLIEYSDGTIEEIEIATFRRDITKGRHPKIEFTTSIEEDAQRRDFTINALYESADGTVIDPTGMGLSDINSNTLRFIGNAQDRISEDPLRIFRFVRFLASKGFVSAHKISECQSWKADFTDVSKERILKELEKTFGGRFLFSGSITPFMFFMACGIHRKIGMSQLMIDMSNTEQSWKWHSEGSTWIVDGKEVPAEDVTDFTKAEPVKHGNVWDHVIRVMYLMQEETKNDPDEHHRFVMMMTAFLHDIGKAHSKPGIKHRDLVFNEKGFSEDIPDVTDHDEVGAPIAEQFCRDLGMSCNDAKLVFNLTANHMRVHRLGEMSSKYKIWKIVSEPFFNDLVTLAKCDERSAIKTCKDEWPGIEKSLEDPEVASLIGVPMPQPVVTGNDLIVSLGLKPNPNFKKILEVTYKVQINKNCVDKAVLLNAAKSVNNN